MAETVAITNEGDGVNLWVPGREAPQGPPRYLEVGADGVPIHGQAPENVARVSASGVLPLAGIVIIDASSSAALTLAASAIPNRGARTTKIINETAGPHTITVSGGTFIHGGTSGTVITITGVGSSVTLTGVNTTQISITSAEGSVMLGSTLLGPTGQQSGLVFAEHRIALTQAQAAGTTWHNHSIQVVSSPGNDGVFVYSSNINSTGRAGFVNTGSVPRYARLSGATRFLADTAGDQIIMYQGRLDAAGAVVTALEIKRTEDPVVLGRIYKFDGPLMSINAGHAIAFGTAFAAGGTGTIGPVGTDETAVTLEYAVAL